MKPIDRDLRRSPYLASLKQNSINEKRREHALKIVRMLKEMPDNDPRRRHLERHLLGLHYIDAYQQPNGIWGLRRGRQIIAMHNAPAPIAMKPTRA